MIKNAMISCYKGTAHPEFCDVMGHMNIRHYMAMFDESSFQFLFQVFGWSSNQSEGRGWADVKHVIEYQAEVRAGDLIEVRACMTKIGNKSFGARYEMINQIKDEVAATLDCVCVSIDLASRKAIPLSDSHREQAAQHME
jgi:acyl-CoA thioester hydrolase